LSAKAQFESLDSPVGFLPRALESASDLPRAGSRVRRGA
jgi:hypothetical protein